MKCPFCSCDRQSPSIPGRVRCCACHLVFRTDGRSQWDWDRDDYAHSRRLTRYYGDHRNQFYRWVINQLERRSEAHGAWLDVGCGTGGLLAQLDRTRWSPIGLDLSETAVNAARENGISAVVGAFPDYCPLSRVSAISFIFAVEYFTDPVRTFQACRELLAGNGALLIVAKNLGFWQWLEWRYRSHSGIWCPADLISYSRETLGKVLASAGFSRRTFVVPPISSRIQIRIPMLEPNLVVIAE